MAESSHIEWTDATWNPITGCTMVSAGCTNCYAMRLAAGRLRNHPSRAGLTRETGGRAVWTGEVRLNEQWLDQPLRWRRPRMIFVCAHGDLFHEAVPDEWIDRVFAVMALAPQHTFQVLTKRPERARAYLKVCAPNFVAVDPDGRHAHKTIEDWPLPNVWLGTSVEDQATADARIPHLLATRAAVRFVSAEPLLGPVDLAVAARGFLHPNYINFGLHWVIVGGESGPGARPMHPEWARGLRDQCQAAGVAFFFKQWGDWAFTEIDGAGKMTPGLPVPRHIAGWRRWEGGCFRGMGQGESAASFMAPGVLASCVGKARAGRLLDGREWNEMPGAANA